MKWLTSLPKNALAVLAIGAGMILIILSSPPHSVCDSQLEVFKESQKQFLYKPPSKKKIMNTTEYERLRDRCKSTNTPGGCYELFQGVKILLEDLTTVASDCASDVGGIKEVKTALWEMADLLVRLAWGEKPPSSYQSKFGWLDTADITLFCKLRDHIVRAYGEPAWAAFREKTMSDLPGAKDMTRTQVWEFVLFSENCTRFP